MDDTRRQRVARHLFHNASDALFLFDPGGHRVLDANAAARRLTGYDAGALRAMTLEALFEAERGEAGTDPDPDPDPATTRAPRRGFRLRRRQGRPIAVSVG